MHSSAAREAKGPLEGERVGRLAHRMRRASSLTAGQCTAPDAREARDGRAERGKRGYEGGQEEKERGCVAVGGREEREREIREKRIDERVDKAARLAFNSTSQLLSQYHWLAIPGGRTRSRLCSASSLPLLCFPLVQR
eukprot:scaffold15799_cov28-Tisochrysis_lutea.AAC.7